MLKKISSYVIVLVIGGVLGTYFDAKHTIEEKTVYKDRTNTIVKERIIRGADGTEVTERETVKHEAKDGKSTKKESIPVKKNWGVSVKTDLLVPDPRYTIEVHRRIFSDIYVSAYGRTDNTVGLGVTFFF